MLCFVEMNAEHARIDGAQDSQDVQYMIEALGVLGVKLEQGPACREIGRAWLQRTISQPRSGAVSGQCWDCHAVCVPPPPPPPPGGPFLSLFPTRRYTGLHGRFLSQGAEVFLGNAGTAIRCVSCPPPPPFLPQPRPFVSYISHQQIHMPATATF